MKAALIYNFRLLTAMLMLLPLICSGVEPASEKDPKSTVKSEKEYAQLTSAIALKRRIPLIQVKYKTPKQDIAFETAQYDFVSASKDIETTFQAASISKVVFSYIVMRMVDRGEIDLDKPLWEYLGYLEERFKDAYPDNPDKSRQNEEWAKRLTARIVLTHGTGLPNWMVRGKPGNGKLIFKCEPNTKYTYSGEGIHYLQRVVEHITGKSLEELAVQEVFKPLGMNYTSYEWREDYNKLAAHGYNNNLECSGQAAKRAANAAYTMRTNVKDFSLFLNALMKGKGLKKKTFKEMMTPQRPLDTEGMYFGLGIRVTPESNYGRVWSHSGSNRNFRCKFWLFPDKKNYLIYFTNSENGGGDTRKDLIEIFIPDYDCTDL